MDRQTAFAFCMIGLAITGITFAVTDPFDLGLAYADKHPTFLQDSKNDYYFDEYGQLTKSVHGSADRLLDYYDYNENPVYVKSKVYETPTAINYESAQASYSFIKSDCSLLGYDGGKLTGQAQKKTIHHIMKTALNGTDVWTDDLSNNVDCNFKLNGNNQIVATKSNFDNATNTGSSYDVVYDFDDFGFVEWTYKTTNKDITKTDQKYGFAFVCDGVGCDSIVIDGQPVSVGDTKLKSELMNKNIKIDGKELDLKEEQHGSTWALKKPQANKMVIDFTDSKGRLAVGDELVIDPIISPSGSLKRYVSTSTTSGTCSTIYSSNDVTAKIKSTDSVSNGSCDVLSARFSLSGFPTSQQLASVTLSYTVDSQANGNPLRVNPMTNDPDVGSGQTILDDIRDGIPYISSDTKAQNTGRYTTDLGSQSVTDIQNALDISQTWFALGLEYDTELARDSLTHSTTMSNLELELFYNMESTFSKPMGLTNEAKPYLINGTFSCPENNCSGLTGVSLWNATETKYAEIPLPDNAGTDTEYPSVDGALDFSDNEILFHFNQYDSNREIQDLSGSNNNSTVIGFSPLDIDGLVAWYDASDSDTITISTGVSQWDDKSGNANHLTQGTGSKQPTVIPSGLNDLDVLDWDSTSTQQLSRTTWTGGSISQPFTIVFVGGYDAIVSASYVYDSGSGVRCGVSVGSTTYQPYCGTGSSFGTATTGDYLYFITHNNSSGVFDRAGSSEGSFSAGESNGMNGIIIGNYQADNPANDFNGQIGELFVIENLSSSDANDLTAYLEDKWNVIGYGYTYNSNIPELSLGLFDNSISSFPLNFTSSDTLMESTQNSQVGSFARLNNTSDLNLLAYNVTGNDNPNEIGVNSTKMYVRYDGNDIASVDNDCNIFSWCFYAIDRNGNTFSFFQNATLKGTNSSSQDLGIATNNMFFIGGNATESYNESLIANLDEYYINDASNTTQILRIAERGFNSMAFLQNFGNQTHAECPAGIEETVYCRAKLMNAVGNGTASDLIYGTTDGLPDSPSISASPTSETSIDVTRTAGASDGGDAITHYDLRYELNGSGGWVTLVTNGTITSPYSHTGLTSGDELVYQWRDRNGVGYSTWSGNTTSITHEDTTATVSHSGAEVVGNVALIEPTISILNGSPEPVLQQLVVLLNGSTTRTEIMSATMPKGNTTLFDDLLFVEIPTGASYNATIQATISNTTGSIVFESSGEIVSREYEPSDTLGDTVSLGYYNYTIDATDPGNRILKVNRPFDNATDSWLLNCKSVTGRNNAGLQWYNNSEVGFVKEILVADSGKNVYVECYNPNLILFSTVSYGNLTGALAGFSGFDEQLGSWFGLPMIFMFVFFVAGLFGGRQSGTSMVVTLAVIAILGGIGLIAIDETLWGIMLVLGALGLFASRVRF